MIEESRNDRDHPGTPRVVISTGRSLARFVEYDDISIPLIIYIFARL